MVAFYPVGSMLCKQYRGWGTACRAAVQRADFDRTCQAMRKMSLEQCEVKAKTLGWRSRTAYGVNLGRCAFLCCQARSDSQVMVQGKLRGYVQTPRLFQRLRLVIVIAVEYTAGFP
jgi:hypothetical protein